MNRLAQENLVAVLLLLVFGGVIWLCQDFGPRARMIPLPLAVFGIVLTIVQLLWQNLRSTDDLQMDLITVGQPDGRAKQQMAGAHAAAPTAPVWRRELAAGGLVALFIVLILAVGLIPAVFLFTGGYFVVSHQYNWVPAVAYTTLFTAVIYLLFIVALQVQLYHGLLQPLIDSLK